MKELISKVKRAIKKGDLIKKAFCLFLIKIGFSNNELQALQIRYKNYLKVLKKYDKYKYNSFINNKCSPEEFNTIWICWLQGEENAPNLVQRCIESVRYYMPEKRIIIISEDNYKSYISLPNYIQYKWKKGIISNTHFSDILRTELLVENGGIWLDSTVFLTGRIPDYMLEKELFLYSHSNRYDLTHKYNSWLIVSKKNNYILEKCRDLLFDYWKNENRLHEYFLWHLFFTMVTDKAIKRETEIYKVSDQNPELLNQVINDEYSSRYMDVLKTLTPIHKLSNKKVLIDNNKTYASMILNGKRL